MIKIDVSSVFPKKLWAYLLGLIPGMVFVLTVAFGDPMIINQIIERIKQAYPFPAYALIFLLAASCLVIGETFFLLGMYVMSLIDALYRAQRYAVFDLTLGSDWLYIALGRLKARFGMTKFQRLSRIIMWARSTKAQFHLRPVWHCQRIVINQILIRKYGISDEMSAGAVKLQGWMAGLDRPPAEFPDALWSARTFLECGLAECVAFYIAPALRNRYFVVICAVFLITGLFESVRLIRRTREPFRLSVARLRGLLEQLAETGPASSKREKNGLTVSADAGET
jgi:hypothetical protein